MDPDLDISQLNVAAAAMEIADRGKPLPVSFAQRQMWLLQQTAPDDATYNVPVSWRFGGPVDADKVRRALQGMVVRHEIFRTALVEEGTIQQIAPTLEVPWATIDLSHVAPDRKEAALNEAVLMEARRPFDLAQVPLWCARWIELGVEERALLCVFHHSIIDESSLRAFARELETLYASNGDAAQAGLSPLPIQFADCAAWEIRELTGAREQELRAYWDGQLSDLAPMMELPADRRRPSHPSGAGATYPFQVDEAVAAKLRALAVQEKTSLWTVMLAAFEVWLYRNTGQDDLIVTTPLANRQRPEAAGLMGCFLNLLPIRSRLTAGQSFVETVRQVQATALGAFGHARLPFDRILESATKQPGGPRPEALYRVMFDLQEERIPDLKFGGTVGRYVAQQTATSKNDLTLSLDAEEPGLRATLEVATDLFSAVRAASFARQLAELFQSIADDPGKAIGELRVLPAVEREQIVIGWNQTARDYPRDKCVQTLFEEQVARTPDATAVVFEDQSLTYRELNARANRLANYLRKIGVTTGALVGICVERSPEMVVALLGVLKAGGAYVPLDPNYPKDRVAFVLEDAAAKVLLTQADLDMPAGNARLVKMDADGPEIARESDANPANVTTPEQLAYVIYTSGSTGLPKGVEIPHRALVNFLESMRETPGLVASDVLLAVTTISFDIAGLEMFLPLITGARIVLLKREEAADGASLVELLKAHKVTVLQATPVTWRLLLEAKWPGTPRLKMLSGGEPLPRELARQLVGKGAELWNMYGPTETTVWSSLARVGRDDLIHIGRPIANTELYILDAQLQPVPVGVAGELHIGGDGLARGYHNRPELSAEKFIAHPLKPEAGARLYKTGDLARFLPDGNIEHLGRLDHQVKVRGYRIELGEIEHVLNQQPGVQNGVVVAREDVPGEKRLVAYTVAENGDIPASELREHLREKLPDYMVPEAFVALRQMPMTPNGKVDRKALPKPEGQVDARPDKFVAPGTSTEVAMAAIWREAFGLERIGILDNFFDLGGHSLLAVRLIGKVNQALGLNYTARVLFQHPTIQSLAAAADSKNKAAPVAAVPSASGSRPPLFFLHGDWVAGDFYSGRLAQRLDKDQPFHVLEPYSTSDNHVLTLEEMARHHLTEIRQQAPHGPYFLGGYCIGATVAMELAQQLLAQGEKVAGLLLIDPAQSASPWIRRAWPVIDSVGATLNWDLRKRIDYLGFYGPALVRWLRKSPYEKLVAVFRRLGMVRPSPHPIAPESETEINDLEILNSTEYALYILAYRLYEAKPLAVPAAIYLPRETPPPPQSWLHRAQELLRFCTIETVPGDHRTCIINHSAELGDQMERALRTLASELPK